ncbi:MAG: alanine--tRNA ligase [Phycisphaeraceae bacterium]|nr:alanine--tRNA ligase [Phycisphaeraceae bacterium]
MSAHPFSVNAVRQQFIDFFVEKHAHRFVPSSPVVPHNDPTLLFTNAGMNQFKPIFLGQVEPGSDFVGLKRAANSQKCIRAGGKHNDLEDVGRDTYHHTFFEMLGNWSFGDYFKAEAIEWAWELLTKVWKLDPERLYASYFKGNKEMGLDPDREAFDLWKRYLPESRILPFGMKDNFWEMGETGPCGPCSEIHYDGRSDEERRRDPGYRYVNADDPRVIEIWNLVFIQFNRTETALRPLPAKHVDTGMGLERITRVLQGAQSNYDTDAFTPLFDAAQRVTGAPKYEGSLEGARDIAYRVVADHIRTLTFALTDGAVPSNEGRGYVLRRILRRAVVQGTQHLGAKPGFLASLVPTVVEHMGHAFPELKKNPDRVASLIREEEESFGRTLDRGIAMFNDAATRAGGSKRVSAGDAFMLHDTYGFPIDLTQVMARERGMSVDTEGYEKLMEEARERSRAGGKAEGVKEIALSGEETAKLAHLRVKPTDDSFKYEIKPLRATVRAIWNGEDFDEDIVASGTSLEDRFGIVLDKTNFYAESGGQVGDHGEIRKPGSPNTRFDVDETRAFGGYVLHIGRLHGGQIKVGDTVELTVDEDRRLPTMANHTATHLLNLALRRVVGDEVDQKGSLVAPDRLRFDFSCAHALTEEQVERVEEIVREQIVRDLKVHTGVAPLADAKTIRGLRAVFGEKYPDPVRVVSIGASMIDLLSEPENPRWQELSIEFCGGSHLAHTGQARAFAVLSEEAVAKGVRRVIGVTGVEAEAAIEAGHRVVERANAAMKVGEATLAEEVAELQGQLEALSLPYVLRRRAQHAIAQAQDRLKSVRKKEAAAGREGAVDAARALAQSEDGPVIVGLIPAGSDREALLAAMDAVRSKRPEAAVLLVSADDAEGKVSIVAQVPETLVKRGLKAGDWVREASAAVGGKGGGRPDAAQGGGTDPSKSLDAVANARTFAASKVS